ncbi:peptide deformylase [Flavobacterium macacae]|uniref:Peptide deformylase n=1 Tax=Flavobacterium macacae TaxID=2488993 RepID=A0A3P3WGA3_9FLAO|nr:peptide deformylase [Flavobacterium macacae]RRJ93468.1 peptide deformylase [Flavobacterium macacae]
MKNTIQLLFLFVTITCSAQKFSKEERKLIQSGDAKTMLKVIETTDEKELKILRSVSIDINPKDDLVALLAERMFVSMRDPKNPGIGIAAPQIGINRNIIWAQRFDKIGEPFELYLNPKIVWRSQLLQQGSEGCLSIPDFSGNVLRNYIIKLTYQDKTGKHVEELVEGFTAVIFQHETDHLNGILFTDRMKEQEKIKLTSVTGETNLFLEKK